ncbi:MAG: hypothetical protein LBP80_08150 [Treponema sp.]|nr:hypothetical protein [Treponema sp.]
MKKLLCAIFLFCCLGFALSAGGSAEPPSNPDPASPSPAPAPTPSPAPASPFFSGDGGKGLSIAILAPQAKGIAGTPDYLPALVQGEFVSNFSGYSAISVLDRQRLDDQYTELLSGYYDDNAQAGADLGHLTPTTHIMGGSVTRTATGYALQMQITKTADKMTAASYSGTCTFAELDNLSGIRRASLALLEKMGVKPTERARTELAGAAASHEINAQTALAQGITAQKSGTEIAALSYYIQASVLDGDLAEAASRLNIVTASITSGDMGADIRNDLQWRDQWVARLAECEMFFAKNVYGPYPYYLVYSTNIIEGATDYEKRTVALGVTIGSYPNMPRYRSIAQAVDTVRKGLLATGRAKLWKLDNWPLQSVAIPGLFRNTWNDNGQKNAATLYCSGYTAIVEIVNSDGKTIASSTVGFPLGFYSFHEALGRPGEFYFLVTMISAADIVFPSVDPNDITPTMAIRIAGINGQSAETWAAANSLSILSEADYQKIPGVIPLLTRVVEKNNVSFAWSWSVRRAGLGYGISRPLSAGEVQGETTFPMGYSIFREVTGIMVNSIIPLYMKPPDVTLWEGTSGTRGGGAKFWVIHHGVTDPQKRLDRFSESSDIGIYPSTTKSFSGKYGHGHNSGGPAAYFPAGNISVPVGAFLGRSMYLGANLTLTNIDYNGRSENHPLIDIYNENGKKEGWYVHNGYTAIQWSRLDVSHSDIYTYIPR